MLQKLLIANRGEIACRIAKTARRLGIAAVAVYSEADAQALHVAVADEAWPIGPAPAQDSYLAIDKILDVARRSGAQAAHPGYGFLAENPKFAERCEAAGVIFVGPSAKAMRLLGSKASAKSLLEAADAPVAPGYHADDPDDATLAREATRIGFPLIVKASAGGGGRGMRIIRSAAELADAVAGARREALASFGDGRLLIERYLERARHIEVQIFADAFGGVVAFSERDCSLQRRCQKILEETPAPGLSPALRRALREAAIAAARCVDYLGAGTVEFLVQDDAFYFLEMNTRLQVEHPITEMIAGVDLVEWQLRVACGEPLPLAQDDLDSRGCAIEARICAEDAGRGFLPSAGVIEHYRAPAETSGVRVDTGVGAGDRVTHYYDSLLAKLVVRGDTRSDALDRLRRALDEFEIAGVTTNLDFLRGLARCAAFVKGDYDAGFVEREFASICAASETSDALLVLAAGAAARLSELRRLDRRRASEAGDAFSPWASADAWRMHERGACELLFDDRGVAVFLRAWPLSEEVFRLETPAASVLVAAAQSGDRLRLRIDGVERHVGIVRRDNGVIVIVAGRNHFLGYVDSLRSSNATVRTDALLRAPIPARVTRVLVAVGERVKRGASLIVLEAMKMEFTLTAPRDGGVASICCAEGELTQEGVQLITLAEEEST